MRISKKHMGEEQNLEQTSFLPPLLIAPHYFFSYFYFLLGGLLDERRRMWLECLTATSVPATELSFSASASPSSYSARSQSPF